MLTPGPFFSPKLAYHLNHPHDMCATVLQSGLTELTVATKDEENKCILQTAMLMLVCFIFSLPYRAEKTEVLSDDLLQVTSPLSSVLHNTGHLIFCHCNSTLSDQLPHPSTGGGGGGN